jgi:hypothetical protein
MIHVQPILIYHNETLDGAKMPPVFLGKRDRIDIFSLAVNDGFFDENRNVCEDDFIE